MLYSVSVLVFLLPLLAICNVNGQVHNQQDGVYVSINETAITNNGYVSSYDMIQNGLPLFCHTNKMDCCRDERLGDWFYPNGTTLKSFTVNVEKQIPEFFARNRGPSRVRLDTSGIPGLRTSLGPPERGQFHCEVPDANDVTQTVHVNILDIGVMTVTSSVSTDSFGRIFSLLCSVDIFNDIEELGVPPPTFEWFFGPNGNASLPSGVAVSTVTNNGTTYTSTLLFSPPKASHAGTYRCRLGGNPRLEANATITVNTADENTFSQRTTSQSSPETGVELFYCVIVLCSIILFAVLASTFVIISLLCVFMRNDKRSKESPPDNSLYVEVDERNSNNY